MEQLSIHKMKHCNLHNIMDDANFPGLTFWVELLWEDPQSKLNASDRVHLKKVQRSSCSGNLLFISNASRVSSSCLQRMNNVNIFDTFGWFVKEIKSSLNAPQPPQRAKSNEKSANEQSSKPTIQAFGHAICRWIP